MGPSRSSFPPLGAFEKSLQSCCPLGTCLIWRFLQNWTREIENLHNKNPKHSNFPSIQQALRGLSSDSNIKMEHKGGNVVMISL